jgi:putative transcriptional regulator
MDSTARRLLVSIPTLTDPNFFRSVVFVLEHDADGAFGLVLNQPSSTRVDVVLDAWASLASEPSVLFVGGPVQRNEALVALGRMASTARTASGPVADAWQPLLGPVGTVDLAHDPDALSPDLAGLRVFAGYSGWGPGQLDGEIEAGGWFVVDALPGDLLTTDPSGLWRAVLRRQGGELAVNANYPLGEGPALN